MTTLRLFHQMMCNPGYSSLSSGTLCMPLDVEDSNNCSVVASYCVFRLFCTDVSDCCSESWSCWVDSAVPVLPKPRCPKRNTGARMRLPGCSISSCWYAGRDLCVGSSSSTWDDVSAALSGSRLTPTTSERVRGSAIPNLTSGIVRPWTNCTSQTKVTDALWGRDLQCYR